MEKNREEVIAWLEAGEAADYRAGVLLLQDHGSNRSLVNTLLKKESAAHREKLRYELCKCLTNGRLSDVAEVQSHFALAVQSAVGPSIQPLAEQPAPALVEISVEARSVAEELTVKMQMVYNRRCQLSNSLAEIPEGDGPRVVAEILALQEEYNQLAQQRKQAASGQPLEPEATAPASALVADRASLRLLRNNLSSRVSKAKKDSEKKPDDQLKAEKYAKLQAELEEMEMQIKQLPVAAPAA